jgi:hypothetical protein
MIRKLCECPYCGSAVAYDFAGRDHARSHFLFDPDGTRRRCPHALLAEVGHAAPGRHASAIDRWAHPACSCGKLSRWFRKLSHGVREAVVLLRLSPEDTVVVEFSLEEEEQRPGASGAAAFARDAETAAAELLERLRAQR